MTDHTTHDGKKITIDIYKISIGQYNRMFSEGATDDMRRELIARCCGLTLDEYDELPLPDGAALQTAFWDECRKIFEKPKNSESAPS